jgi:hypothetical protein
MAENEGDEKMGGGLLLTNQQLIGDASKDQRKSKAHVTRMESAGVIGLVPC